MGFLPGVDRKVDVLDGVVVNPNHNPDDPSDPFTRI